MIVLGLDDTDTLDTPGTNQLARRIADTLPPGFRATLVLRHQLLFDRRIPYTSQNGSASLALDAEPEADREALLRMLRGAMREWYVPGSDPGLCLAEQVPDVLVEFGRRCQREIVRQEDARDAARVAGVHLEGFGGTEGGVIGALAAVRARGVDLLLDGDRPVERGTVDLGKHLRPSYRGRRVVLFVEPGGDGQWRAVKLP